MLWILLCIIASASTISVVVLSKRLLDSVDEFSVACLYFVFTFLVLSPILFSGISSFEIPFNIMILFPIIGILNVLAIFFYMKAIKSGDLSKVVPIRNSTPLFVAILAIFFLAEQPELNVFISCGLIILGSFLLNKEKSVSGHDPASLKYAFGVAIIASFVFIIMKHSVSMIDPFAFNYLSFLSSSVIGLLFVVGRKKAQRMISFIEKNLSSFIIIGILTAIASVSIVYAASLEAASMVSAFLRVELLFGLAAGQMFFNEKLTKETVAGALLVFIGLILVIF
jgi:transporter family protein